MLYLQSGLSFISINATNQTTASVAERGIYFIEDNSLSSLFSNVRTYAIDYLSWKTTTVQQKVNYTTTMSFICIGLILASGIAIIPLSGRV
jgi:hypothetical protein